MLGVEDMKALSLAIMGVRLGGLLNINHGDIGTLHGTWGIRDGIDS